MRTCDAVACGGFSAAASIIPTGADVLTCSTLAGLVLCGSSRNKACTINMWPAPLYHVFGCVALGFKSKVLRTRAFLPHWTVTL